MYCSPSFSALLIGLCPPHLSLPSTLHCPPHFITHQSSMPSTLQFPPLFIALHTGLCPLHCFVPIRQHNMLTPYCSAICSPAAAAAPLCLCLCSRALETPSHHNCASGLCTEQQVGTWGWAGQGRLQGRAGWRVFTCCSSALCSPAVLPACPPVYLPVMRCSCYHALQLL
jgi:hypothetical protein